MEVVMSWRTFFAVSFVLISSFGSAMSSCQNLPGKTPLTRIQEADLVVYGLITNHKAVPGTNEQNVQDHLTITVTLNLYCVLKNDLSSSSIEAALDKTQINFDAVYYRGIDCQVQNEVPIINEAKNGNIPVVVTLKYDPEKDVKFEVDQINEESAIHMIDEDSEFYRTVKGLADAGFIDLSTDSCEPKPIGNEASTFRFNLLMLFAVLASFYILY